MHIDYGYAEDDRLGKPYDVKLLRRIFPFVQPYMRWMIVSIALIIVITLVDLAVPYITKIAIDGYIVPRITTEEADRRGPGPDKTRLIKADLTDPAHKDIVDRRPDLFDASGDAAFIHIEDLPALSKKEIRTLREKDLSGLGKVAALFLGVIILNFILNFIQVMLMEYAGQRIMHDLRVKLFSHTLTLSMSFFNRNPVGRLVTRATNDVQNMHELFTSVVAFLFKDVFLLAGIAIVMLSLDWKLALASFTVLPFVLFISLRFSGRARDIFRILRVKIAEINTRFSESIDGVRVLQLFLQERENHRKFKILNHEYYQAGIAQIRIFAVFMPLIEMLGSVGVAIVIFYGGRGVLSETITIGALAAFISYMRMFFRPIRDISEKYSVMQNAMASAERLFLILDRDETLPRIETADPAPADMDAVRDIEFRDVTFEYVPGEPILKNISFRLSAGETLALAGPTGSGKTTMINLLIRFYDPASGAVFINGRDMRTLDPADLRAKTALVTQDPFLFSGTIKENIFPGRDGVSQERVKAVLEAANCHTLIRRLPKGADTELSGGASAMSSGERQLISIARAFAREPEVIILDEATSYVDAETEARVQAALANLMAGRTAVIVAHRLTTARQADAILMLNKGRIIESGSHDRLMARKGFYYNLVRLQDRPLAPGDPASI